MEERRAFVVLGTEPKDGEDAVRAAYRKKLRLVNPEDDPKGFLELREAYETALACLERAKAGTKEEKDESPSGLFLQRVQALYDSLEKRQEEGAWDRLFSDPAFLDLEEEENCRKKLFVWLMSHSYLPTQIWKTLDRHLSIAADREKLLEEYPSDFVGYLVRKVREGEEFSFEQLKGEDGADIDGWILLFIKAGREERENNDAALEETIREARKKGLSHPDLSMILARLRYRQGSAEEGDAIVQSLLEGEFGQSPNVLFQAAEYYRDSDRQEAAHSLYEQLLEEMPDHYMANRRMAQRYLELEDYARAKKCVNVLLTYPMDEETKALIQKVNEGLSVRLRRTLAENPEDFGARMELGWCCLQENEPNEAIALIEAVVPAADQEKEYVNLAGKAYYAAECYSEALPRIQRWIDLLKRGIENGEGETGRDLERLATAWTMMAEIAAQRGKAAPPGRKDPCYLQAIQYLDRAKEAHETAGQEYTRARIYLEWGQYEECARICGKLTEEYPGFGAAYALHQKACAKLFDASGVVRDYRALLQLIPSYAGSRELAAEVFYQLNEREELDSLLKEAQEAGVLTAELKRYRFLLMAAEAKTREALLQALDYARTVHEQGEKEGWSDGQKARLYALRARNYWRIQGVDTALQLIEKAILLDPEDSEYVYIKAGLCKDKRDYEEALKLYLQCESDYDQTPHFYANVGECYDSMGQKDEALSWLERAAQMEPDNAGVRARILRIFRAQPKQLALEEVRQKAELYARQMTESGNSAWHWIESGLLYMELQEYGQAANQLERAVAADPEDPFAHSNLARAYRLLNRPADALREGKEGVAYFERDPAPWHWEVLGDIYRQQHEYGQALDAYLENWKRFPKQRSNFLYPLIELYCLQGNWQQAMQKIGEIYPEQSREYAAATVRTYSLAGFWKQAARYVRYCYPAAGFDLASLHSQMARLYWYQGKLRNAAACMQSALRILPEDSPLYSKYCLQAADIWFYRGKREKAARMAQKAWGGQKEGEETEQANWRTDGGLRRLYELGTLYLYRGDLSKAWALAEKMERQPHCSDCVYGFCTDARELKAGILTAQGDFPGAVRILEEILEESPMDLDVKMKITLLKKRGGIR